ncbi:unnamed protein product [Moneuplotes crassus]|uniref:Superoxide dismutase n=1 Tax=Euplotes crassus TaxID=5936 RepID=A0A346TLN1_EUPCR|nr:Mn superoxide dismutase [Moneuplotes crassus]CAI2379788.1 unnamed protein product [Moneuplotes crassus]|mmetsp:Transcript_26614/g.26498  ORF Transcript_26614/g.26498 Transcript_26614/m.26498 type:complete len:224 (-) Transcript_26614:48-719(-)|eukprot:CAMPEP_0197004170 /NCGR_PEP_ID=MMETSP1380-20130617/19569_1 /TAXON_ID=5936 /ORGANISM="Euplotes crassus, Strain CT5" /LENGTH=223 /DNA_ID=CAMNT_0042422869 /DNA_START=15 /DNA_END=686 /DNA_ORIENTATION=+
MLNRVLYKRSKLIFTRAFSSKVELEPLPWEISSLEPTLSGHLLDFHYNKHHQTYVNNLNALLEQQGEALANGDHKTAVNLAPAIRFHGGGHVNHTFFWKSLAPKSQGGGDRPSESGAFGKEVAKTWGSFDNLITDFNTRSAPLQGSGWAWITYDKNAKTIGYTQTSNQDLITEKAGLVPLLTIDLWEHAYYLDYKNARPDFLSHIWDVINWERVEKRFNEATK